MKTIINLLTEQTQEFKAIYMTMIRNYSKREFENQSQIRRWINIDWCNYFRLDIQSLDTSNIHSMPTNFYNTSSSKVRSNMQDKARRITDKGLDIFIKEELKAAEIHFENSIIKLALRIAKKDLNRSNLKCEVKSLNVNLDIFITDGIKTVHAYTIIAEGPIQRPHYRYLIK